MEESLKGLLDRADLRILRTLQAEGRLTNAELATRVNASAATCHRRTQRLFEEGYITGVRAEIAPASVGLGALVMVGEPHRVCRRPFRLSYAATAGASSMA